MASSPWVELAGADNVRDLGGLPVRDGRRTRRASLLRSGTLQHLTEDDVRVLVEEIGLRTVVDLRLADEAEREGSALHGVDGVAYLSLPLWSADRVRADAVAYAEMDIVDHYLAFLDGSAETVVTAARTFADPDRLPAVFHCAAGKDRTGVLAAVLLDAVGVTHEAIVADYARTEERIDAIRARLAQLETYRRMRAVARGTGTMTADADTMRRFLDHLTTRYGGGAGYLAAHGATDDDLDALTAALVDDEGDA
jgi:protein tyrosine/serine phosphatase